MLADDEPLGLLPPRWISEHEMRCDNSSSVRSEVSAEDCHCTIGDMSAECIAACRFLDIAELKIGGKPGHLLQLS